MGVRCDWLLLLYIQIITIKAITLPLTTTSKSIPVKPKSTFVSSCDAPSSLDDCSTSSTEFIPLCEDMSKFLKTFLSSPVLPSKVSNPCDAAIKVSNFVKLSEISNGICVPTDLDSCNAASNLISNIISKNTPLKKGFTAPLSLTVTTSENPTKVLIKPSLRCGTQNLDKLTSSPISSCGDNLAPEIIDLPRLLPPPNTNVILFTEISNATPIRLPHEGISEVSTTDSVPLLSNTLYNSSPSLSKKGNSPEIILTNLSPTPTLDSPKFNINPSFDCDSKNLDTILSLPNVVSYFFPSLPKVAAVPGSTLSAFNLNPIAPEESPSSSVTKPHESNYYSLNNFDSFVLSPSPPKLVTSNVNPFWYPPQDGVVLQKKDNSVNAVSPNMVFDNNILPNIFHPPKNTSPSYNLSQNNLDTYSPSPNIPINSLMSPLTSVTDNINYVSSKPVLINSDTVSKNSYLNNVPTDVPSQRVVESLNIPPVLTADNLNCPYIKPTIERSNKSDAPVFISSTKYCNNVSSSLYSGTVLPSPNLSSTRSLQNRLPNKLSTFSSTLNVVSNTYPLSEVCNSGFVTKPNLFIDAPLELSNSRTALQEKPIPKNINPFYNNLQYFPNTIISPNFLPLPNLRPTITSEYYNNFYPYISQETSYYADITEGSTPQLYPLPKSYVYSPIPLTSVENVPPKVTPSSSIDSLKSNKMQNPTGSVPPHIIMSIANVNSFSPSPINISPISSLETTTTAGSPSLSFDLNSSLNKYPQTNKESVPLKASSFCPQTVAKQAANINSLPNINTISSPPNIIPGVPLNPNSTPIPVVNKETISSAAENILNPASMPENCKLPTNFPKLSQAEDFSLQFLSSPNFTPCNNLLKISESFSSKLNTIVVPPKVSNFSSCYSPEQSPPNPDLISSVIYPFTNPSTSSVPGVYTTNTRNPGTTEYIPNNIAINPIINCATVDNAASLTPARYDTYSSYIPAVDSSPLQESKSPLSDISSHRSNDIPSFNPTVPMNSLIPPISQKISYANPLSNVDSKFGPILNSLTTYSAIPAIVPSAGAMTSIFDYSNTISPKISTPSNDKIVSSINEIASSLTKDILSNILEKNLSKIKTPLVKTNIPLVNPFASKVTESIPSLSGLVCTPSSFTSPPTRVEMTQLNDCNNYLATMLLPDIIKALQLLINTPVISREPELSPSASLTPYISSLTINIMPPVENTPPDTRIVLPSCVSTDFNSPIAPAYFQPPTVSSFPPILPPLLVETPLIKTKSCTNDDSISAQKLLEMILLSELMNGDDNRDWDAMENIMALLYNS